MEEYRKRLKNQNIIFAIGAIALIAVQTVAFSGIINPVVLSNSRWADFWNGFYAGVSMGVTFIFILRFVKNLMAMRNEKTLKKLYVKEHDERKQEICEKGKSAGASACVICMLAAGVIGGYFNITVLLTCVACTVALSLFMIGGKIYYNNKL